MPYRTNEELPVSIRHSLPKHAQDIFREAFNGAWQQYQSSERQEEIAFRVAWAIVKKIYRKVNGEWVRKR